MAIMLPVQARSHFNRYWVSLLLSFDRRITLEEKLPHPPKVVSQYNL